MVLLVHFPLLFGFVISLCNTIIVVKSEISGCVYKDNETVFCKQLPDLSGLQGVIKNETDELILSDSHVFLPDKGVAPLLENLDKVKYITVTKNTDLILEPATLSIFPNLEVVRFSSNHLDLVKTGTFTGLGKLVSLTITRNLIKELQGSIFEGAPNLEYLYLSHNYITTLTNNIFDGLVNLKLLELNNNQIKTIPIATFSDLTSLEYLDLSHNSLKTVQFELFNSLRKMEELYLNDNEITNISGQLKLPELTRLSLASNKLSELSSSVLGGCESLTHVSLSWNRLGNLTEQPFLNLSKLEYLILIGTGASIKNFDTLNKHTVIIV